MGGGKQGRTYTRVLRSKIPQLPLIRLPRPAHGEIIRHVRHMQQDSDRIDQQRRNDPTRHRIIGEDMRTQNRPVGVGEQNEPLESPVLVEDATELDEELGAGEDGVGGQTGGDLRDFETEDADLVVGRGGGV